VKPHCSNSKTQIAQLRLHWEMHQGNAPSRPQPKAFRLPSGGSRATIIRISGLLRQRQPEPVFLALGKQQVGHARSR
jgi:hypothetical protein